jgi:hypothetical protein
MSHALHRIRILELASRGDLAALLPRDAVGCELGVWKGDHAEDLLRNARPRELHLVDNWSWPKDLDAVAETARIRSRFAPEIAAGQVYVHPMSFAEYFASIRDRSLDWVYVDGSHSYADVSRDVWQAWSKIRIGGILCGHDFAIRPEVWGTGVCRAVLEVVQNRAGTLLALSNERLGDWAIRVEIPERSSGEPAALPAVVRRPRRGLSMAAAD